MGGREEKVGFWGILIFKRELREEEVVRKLRKIKRSLGEYRVIEFRDKRNDIINFFDGLGKILRRGIEFVLVYSGFYNKILKIE